MISAYCGPSSRSAISFAAHDTDSVDPLATGIGRLTFHAAVRHAAISAPANTTGFGYASGNDATSTIVPPATTSATYSCAASGSALHDRPLGRRAGFSARRFLPNLKRSTTPAASAARMTQGLGQITGSHAESLQLVPHTTLSSSAVPHTTLWGSVVPQTTL